MIDINLLRNNPELVKENIKKRYQEEKLKLVDEITNLDKEWRKIKYDSDNLRHKRNKTSLEINKLIKKNKKTEAKKLIEKAKSIPKEISKLSKLLKEYEQKINLLLSKIPNILDDSVPIGKDESENVELKKYGKPKIPTYPIINHIELAEKFNGVDLESSRKISGSGFYFLKNKIAILHSAILSYARDFMIKKGFEYIIPPFMIRNKTVKGVMSFEEINNMMYKIENEDLYLIGTSEHSIIGMFKDKTIEKARLPLFITSYSPCFRKEKGAHGIEEKGFFRVHQFEKQEMVIVCEPEDSKKLFGKLLDISIELYKSLLIPFRTVECCSGDLSDLKSKSVDIEAWSPRQKKYFEVGSCSNMTDSQSRRLNIKIRGKNKNYFAHTLNNTVIASPRILIAILENNQNKDGSITVPKVLHKYTGFKIIK